MNKRTHKRIIAGAIECLAQNKNAGLDEIANQAGVGRATLYRYFKCRSRLISAIQIYAGQQLQAAVAPVLESDLAAREKLVQMVIELVPLGASLNVCGYLNHPFAADDPDVIAQYQQHLEQSWNMSTALKNEGVVEPEIPLSWIMGSLDALIFEAWNKVATGDIAPKQAPWLVLTTFLAGSGTQTSREWLAQQKQEHESALA